MCTTKITLGNGAYGYLFLVGGNLLDYSGDVATSTADIATFKILINSTPSTADAAMMMMDIKTAIWALHCHGLNT
jgi:hypothetical protein